MAPASGRPLTLRAHLLRLTLAVLLPALLAGGLTAWELGRAYRQAVENALQGGARTLAVAIDREIEVAVTAASSLAGTRALRALAESGDSAPEEAIAELYERARTVGNAFGGWVLLVRADGEQLFNTQRPLGAPLPAAAAQPWIRRATASGQPAVTNLFTGSVAQRPVLAVVTPVLAPGRRPGEGPAPLAILLAFDPARLAAMLALVREGEIAGLIQVEDGRIIARSLNHATSTGRVAPDWVAAPLRNLTIGQASGPSLDGAAIVAAFQRLDRVPWAVVVTASRATYQAAWRSPLERLVIAGAALLALGLLLAGLLARRLLDPVRALAREAQELAAGGATPSALAAAPVAEFEALRVVLAQAAETTRARSVSEGRAAAAEEAAAELRAERDRARLYFDMAQAVLVVLGPDGRVRSINRHGLSVLGLRHEDEAVGRDWFEGFVPPRLRPQLRRLFQGLAQGTEDGAASTENAVLRADGTERLLVWRNAVLRDAAGRLIAVIASGEDITDRRATEERQTLLMREVDHRAKNALAVVQSILRLTRAERPRDFATAVEGRVNALARAHTLLARESWAGGSLRELVRTELAAYGAEDRLRIEGPPVWLAPDAVQPLSLVLHELATNAAKYGALSAPGGRLAVDWQVEADGGLRLDWREDGAALAGAPAHRGFGSRMIAATVTGQLGGSLTMDWRPAGLHARLRIGADRVALREPATAPTDAEAAAAPPPLARLAGRRILLVEDEPLVALDLEETLRGLGCEVAGPAATLAEALRLAETPRLDAAVLDVNLGGQAAFPVADLLLAQGVPVVFATGYSELPGGWTPEGGQGPTALLRKPVDRAALAAALCRLVPPEAAPHAPL
ncbi:HWE histidine kinase domain-containing protein [Falsiroseomonas sp.]|uniref:HWE histidine kinase domain-containing protein n=1 Tax=Falsiroseomonas sp. TaxID=2870721 RepID=UPI003F71062C